MNLDFASTDPKYSHEGDCAIQAEILWKRGKGEGKTEQGKGNERKGKEKRKKVKTLLFDK